MGKVPLIRRVIMAIVPASVLENPTLSWSISLALTMMVP